MSTHRPIATPDQIERLMRKARRERSLALLANLRRLTDAVRSLAAGGRRLGGVAEPRSC